MPAKYQPDRYYIRHVPNKKIHLFTIIQLICLAALCVIKLTEAGIVLALVVVALVLVRRLMSKLFSKEELEILDDQLPEFVKRKRADEKKKEKAGLLSISHTTHTSLGPTFTLEPLSHFYS
jgi:sodium bicarbonate cotransporter 5